MKFYIVTPTYNALAWLQRCVRSVADQVGQGVEVHHHVQDGGSADGTPEWLTEWKLKSEAVSGYTFSFHSGKDAGMYDAINLAWAQMSPDSDVTAHLNSDEQYLPGALQGVAGVFASAPTSELVLGTYIIVDPESRYICHRRPVMPARWRSQTVCELITCSCFHRCDSFLRHGIRFDTRYRALADLVFYRDIVNLNLRISVCPHLITSMFTVTGDNLAWTEASRKEWKEEMSGLPLHVSRRHGIAYRCNNLLRRVADWLQPAPRVYAVYMPGSEFRTQFRINHPTAHWGMRTVSSD